MAWFLRSENKNSLNERVGVLSYIVRDLAILHPTYDCLKLIGGAEALGNIWVCACLVAVNWVSGSQGEGRASCQPA